MRKSLYARLLAASCIATLSACGSSPQKDASGDATALGKLADSQPSASAETIVPVAVQQAKDKTAGNLSLPVMPPATAPAPAANSTPPAASGEKQPLARLDRYIVVAGDTLAGIAAKPEVYGDARLWPLLSRANANQIGPSGLIFPGQALVIERAHSPADIDAIRGRGQSGQTAASPLRKEAAAAAAASVQSRTGLTKPGTAPLEPASANGPGPSLADFLEGARNAFASGDLAWAAYYYSVYLERRSGDHTVWGELGNVYYRDGNLTDAARAFYNAANLLIDKGQTARALDLLPAIQEGDPALGDALLLRLTTVRK